MFFSTFATHIACSLMKGVCLASCLWTAKHSENSASPGASKINKIIENKTIKMMFKAVHKFPIQKSCEWQILT